MTARLKKLLKQLNKYDPLIIYDRGLNDFNVAQTADLVDLIDTIIGTYGNRLS